ncbi:5-amino-6-(D-ribitylamino)uracil--L-tyrosine 4-hydroxyphenyl transferase CofH [Synechococcus sp. PCC 7336]|uniref:5-amino-6-(D-ribitylamino)uracil--L-tyrosine 4-hydroxyphenyl transferase CofH n=1 Tax=Synechococcus sp. PCC 7336 TaxID=195250 RepID=UPI000347F834|nr:5-amino-6-(D-ribitylamino)uracil--L-tyrosine 4-hydroxyphenyl transferase CofH [Synechococcus sp. PCC 7336]
MHIQDLLDAARAGVLPSEEAAIALADCEDTKALASVAATLRDRGCLNLITYSKKVFIPLTHLCRDVCHYCTFAQTPKTLNSPYMPLDRVLDVARKGAEMGCKEALFSLGEKPELRHTVAREALAEMGYETTLQYLRDAAATVLEETGLLPHLNPGTMTPEEIASLRPVSPSMGIMLESASDRLTEIGMPHYGSPDKLPSVRLQTLRDAGAANIPFSTGILIGIGETRRERIESLLAIRELHEAHGHIQEIIIQNFRAKPNTAMHRSPEPALTELLWTIAVTRILFGAEMSVQAPPNLSPGAFGQIIAAGINDWGGVSPLTPDFINPEAPWPHLEELARETELAGKHLHERLTIYPAYAQNLNKWVDAGLKTRILKLIDAEGLPRTDDWSAGEDRSPPVDVLAGIATVPARVSGDLVTILDRAKAGRDLDETDVIRLFRARGDDFNAVVQAANDLRRKANGDVVSFVVNRNINYTNICYFKCQFCAFSQGKYSENLRGRPYDLSLDDIQRRTRAAWMRGGSEVCMQGGIHPEYTGQTYIDIVKAVKAAVPEMHVHAFSPLEVWQGAASSNLGLEGYLEQLKQAGLSTLPGTAAEILDDEVRAVICPDKIDTSQWFEVMETAHEVGFKTTATIMFGHVDRPKHWARHLLRIRALQKKTGGFTEFVPLPFVHMQAPIYLKGKARRGPTFREAMLVHAVARLALNPYITNIQASWVKLGRTGVVAALNAGCNDLGGTLMNESITRAAGAAHGQETSPQQMRELIQSANRTPRQRATDYGDADPAAIARGMGTGGLAG